MKAVVVTGPYNKDLLSIIDINDADIIIGADSGALMLAQKGLHFDIALGDFDSVTKKDYELLKNYADKVDTYKSTKDYTDTYLAIKECLKRDMDEIIVYGGIGSRLDHTYANMNLLKLGNITFIDNTTKMYVLDPGIYNIENQHKYISFFALEDVTQLSLISFKYEVENINLDRSEPLCISNELEGTISFTEGLLLVIHQNE
jgi:thiamine pyrophosphokinase